MPSCSICSGEMRCISVGTHCYCAKRVTSKRTALKTRVFNAVLLSKYQLGNLGFPALHVVLIIRIQKIFVEVEWCKRLVML